MLTLMCNNPVNENNRSLRDMLKEQLSAQGKLSAGLMNNFLNEALYKYSEDVVTKGELKALANFTEALKVIRDLHDFE